MCNGGEAEEFKSFLLPEAIHVEDGNRSESSSYDDTVPTHASNSWKRALLLLKTWRAIRQRHPEFHAEELFSVVTVEPSAAPSAAAPAEGFDICVEDLADMCRKRDTSALQKFGGLSGLVNKLKTDVDHGINEDEAEIVKRRSVFGSNTYTRKNGLTFWRLLLDTCKDKALLVLMVCSIPFVADGIQGIKQVWQSGGIIALAVVIVICVISGCTRSLQFRRINKEKQNIQQEVIRGGRTVKILIFDIVVGDIMFLKAGDHVPADGLLISDHSLAIDESNMTKETKIDSSTPFFMSGTKIAGGTGTMLVTSVGINTKWGLLARSSVDTDEDTRLQVQLNRMDTFISAAGILVVVVVLAVVLVRFFTGHTKNPDGTVQFEAGHTSFFDAVIGALHIIIFSVGIIVFVIPEELRLAVTLMLAYSMRKMMADKALVRTLFACETVGSVSTICSDITGILTLNQMTVAEAHVCGRTMDKVDNKSMVPAKVLDLLIEGIAENTTGSVFVPEDGGVTEISGSPTEKAILQWAVNLGVNFDAVRSKAVILHAFPFNSEKKRDGVAVKLPDSVVHIHWKGDAESVLSCCSSYIDENEKVLPLDEKQVALSRKAIEDMAVRSLHCVAIAYRKYEFQRCQQKVPTSQGELGQHELPEGDLVLLAIVGIKDPCRSGVREAVKQCADAGIKVRVVTGKNLQIAKAIALECGIIQADADETEPNLIEGMAFRNMSVGQREEVAKKISVMGSSSSEDKLLFVQALRKCGQVVAVTGDGTNDAPALHEADIGLAMGIAGTEVAKEISDIIILDDSFSSIVKVVWWGRAVYANIQKFIQFHLTVIIGMLVIDFVFAFSAGDAPLSPLQLLWVKLIMDTLGALALASEPPTKDLMRRPPVSLRDRLITKMMWRNLTIQVLYQVTIFLILSFHGTIILNLEHEAPDHANKVKNTMIFNTLVLCQLINKFNARKPDEVNVFKGVHKNHLFMGIGVFIAVFQVIIMLFLGKFMMTVTLSWQLWLASVGLGLFSWPVAVVGKLIPVPEMPPFSDYFTWESAVRINEGGQELLCIRKTCSNV